MDGYQHGPHTKLYRPGHFLETVQQLQAINTNICPLSPLVRVPLSAFRHRTANRRCLQDQAGRVGYGKLHGVAKQLPLMAAKQPKSNIIRAIAAPDLPTCNLPLEDSKAVAKHTMIKLGCSSDTFRSASQLLYSLGLVCSSATESERGCSRPAFLQAIRVGCDSGKGMETWVDVPARRRQSQNQVGSTAAS